VDTSAAGGLPLTGERTVPDVPSENYWFRRHEAAYFYLGDVIGGGLVLDVGAGEGYGVAMLRSLARRPVAVDYDLQTVRHLARRYPAVHAVQANLASLPIGTGIVDAVLALQVIEHVWDHPQFLAECVRVLVPGARSALPDGRPPGLLAFSTPNRLTFSPGRDRPANPFHTHEFTAGELAALVRSRDLADIVVRGLVGGPRLTELDQRFGGPGSLVAAQLAAAPDDWSAELVRAVASITTADFVITETADDDSLDLILLARRR
jgi:SAM-dependent methyltransferase